MSNAILTDLKNKYIKAHDNIAELKRKIENDEMLAGCAVSTLLGTKMNGDSAKNGS